MNLGPLKPDIRLVWFFSSGFCTIIIISPFGRLVAPRLQTPSLRRGPPEPPRPLRRSQEGV